MRPPAQFVDPVLQEVFWHRHTLNIPSPLQNFEGVNNVNGVLPPDTNGDVGPNHYMQWVNLSFAIYSKTGALALWTRCRQHALDWIWRRLPDIQ